MAATATDRSTIRRQRCGANHPRRAAIPYPQLAITVDDPAAVAADTGAGCTGGLAEIQIPISRRHRHPARPGAPKLTAHQRYTAAEFIHAIRPAGRRVLAADAPGKSG